MGQKKTKQKETKFNNEIIWTNYDFKHVAKKNIPWKKVVQNTKEGPAKYKPEIDIENLERYVWRNGIFVNNGKSWKIMKLDYIVGAKNGIETSYVRVEKTMNTIHGHPITPTEFLKYTKKN